MKIIIYIKTLDYRKINNYILYYITNFLRISDKII